MREEGASGPEGLVVRRQQTQQELANMIGSCRETISPAFNQLARDGLIIRAARSLVVTPAALIEPAEKKKALRGRTRPRLDMMSTAGSFRELGERERQPARQALGSEASA